MTEASTKPVTISGPITAKEADTLAREQPDSPVTKEVLQRIGAVADEQAVALVATQSATGETQPSHFVALDPQDMGTVLKTTKPIVGSPVDKMKLPSPEVAHAQLIAPAEQTPPANMPGQPGSQTPQ